MAGHTWTLLPMRGLDRGKSRLVPALGEAGRAELNGWLLARTLAVVGRWSGTLARCIVVSPCGRTLEAAARAGALPLQEAGVSDLNHALQAALRAAAARGAQRVLVLPCDLPRLTARALRLFAGEAGRRRHMVLAPDRSGRGTNALLADAHAYIEFRFGPRSLARHRQWAVARGWTVSVFPHPALEFDLDTPADLAQCIGRGGLGSAVRGGDRRAAHRSGHAAASVTISMQDIATTMKEEET